VCERERERGKERSRDDEGGKKDAKERNRTKRKQTLSFEREKLRRCDFVFVGEGLGERRGTHISR